jgi:competence protein ComEA
MEAAPSPLGVAAVSPGTVLPAPAGRAPLDVRLSAPAPVWPRPAQTTAALLLLLALVLMSWHVYQSSSGRARPTSLEPGAELAPVDLNRAGQAELLQLPGVGPALAERVEAYRLQHGGFRDVGELRRVGGIGPVLLERLRPLVFVEGPPTDGEDEEGRAAGMAPAAGLQENRPAAVRKKKTGTERIDVNEASAEELQRLPRIGPKLAARIIETRRQRPFRSVDDLRRVPGIGPRTLDGLRPQVTVGADQREGNGAADGSQVRVGQ